jgi:hypothetical protein
MGAAKSNGVGSSIITLLSSGSRHPLIPGVKKKAITRVKNFCIV